MAKSGRLQPGDSIYGYYRSVNQSINIQPLWRIWPAKQLNSVKNAKWRLLRHSRSFKVIEIGISQKPVCDFLSVINSDWHLISYHFAVIAAYCSKFGHFAFLATFGGLGTTYDVHLGLIGKRVVDFLLMITELFSLDVAAEALRAKIDRKSAISPQRGSVWPKILGRRKHPHQLFCTDS